MGEERVIKATLAAAMGSESDKAVLTSSLGDPTIRLALYALRRQADNGPCSEPMPWPWDLVAHTKWKSWSQLGNMSKFEVARRRRADNILPGDRLCGCIAAPWRSVCHVGGKKNSAITPSSSMVTTATPQCALTVVWPRTASSP